MSARGRRRGVCCSITSSAAALGVALGRLEPQERRMLERFHFEHGEPAVIAAELGISAAAAGRRISRARMDLRKKLVKWTSLID